MPMSPELKRPKVGVAGVVRRADGRVLMIQRGHPPASDLWAFPGGHVEFGESLKDSVVRELYEETGLRAATVGRLLFVAELREVDHHFILLDYAVTLESTSGTAGTVASDARALRWVDQAEASRLPLADGMARCLADGEVVRFLGWG